MNTTETFYDTGHSVLGLILHKEKKKVGFQCEQISRKFRHFGWIFYVFRLCFEGLLSIWQNVMLLRRVSLLQMAKN